MIKLKNGITLTIVIGLAIVATTLSPIAEMFDVTTQNKMYHAMAFAAFTMPMIWVSTRFWRHMIAASVILGAAIEVTQPYVNQVGDIMDLIADMIGALLGVFLGYASSALYQTYKPRPMTLCNDSFDKKSARIFHFRKNRLR